MKWLDETDLHQKCKIRGDFIYEGVPVCLDGYTKKEWIVQHKKRKAQEGKNRRNEPIKTKPTA